MELNYGKPFQIEEVKAAGDSWSVTGYVSTFGNLDHGYDVVMRGAFDKTLGDGHKIRFLREHDSRLVLGVPTSLKADDKGLLGTFKISKTQLGEDTHTLLKDGALDSFSIGYFTHDAEFDDSGARLLKEIELMECSIVSIPMNDRALVTAVKADQPTDLLLREVCTSLGLGLAEAKALFARRAADGREPAERHIAAVKDLLSNAEAAAEALRALLQPSPEPPAEKHGSGLSLRMEIARRRLVHAGILEMTP